MNIPERIQEVVSYWTNVWSNRRLHLRRFFEGFKLLFIICFASLGFVSLLYGFIQLTTDFQRFIILLVGIILLISYSFGVVQEEHKA